MDADSQSEPAPGFAHFPTQTAGAEGQRHKRPVVIDGCNLSNLENNRGMDTGRCISAISYFRSLGNNQIAIVFPRIPSWENRVNASGAKRRAMVKAMEPYVHLSPARLNPATGLTEKSDDDMYLLEMAKNAGAVVVSNDQFRAERAKDPSLADVIDHRLLQFTMAFGNFQVAQDPRGSGNVNLDDVLQFPPGYKPRTLSDDIQELVASDPNLSAKMDQEGSPFDSGSPSRDSDTPFSIRPPIVPTPAGLALRQSSEPSFGGGAPGTPASFDRQSSDSWATRERSRSANSTFSYSSLSDFGNGNGHDGNGHYGNGIGNGYSSGTGHYGNDNGINGSGNGYRNQNGRRNGNPTDSPSTRFSSARSSPGRYSGAARRRGSYGQHRDNGEIMEGQRMGLLYSGFGQYYDPAVTAAAAVPEDPSATGGALTSTQVDTLMNELWPLVYCAECPLGHNRLQAVVRGILSRQPLSAARDAMAMAVIEEVQKARDEAPAIGVLISFE